MPDYFELCAVLLVVIDKKFADFTYEHCIEIIYMLQISRQTLNCCAGLNLPRLSKPMPGLAGANASSSFGLVLCGAPRAPAKCRMFSS